MLPVEKANLYVKMPRERVGTLIGPSGTIKEVIENKLSVKLQIDSEAGNVRIILDSNAYDPSFLFRAKEVVIAIGRGFSPERAFELLRDEEAVLLIIDLREVLGRSPSDMKRLKGRVIGRNGKTRRLIEELTDTNVSVYGHTISIIGKLHKAQTARDAIRMFLKGKQHRTVYRFLHIKRRDFKKEALELWKVPHEI
jgi:ribosomal RNA assembly protein